MKVVHSYAFFFQILLRFLSNERKYIIEAVLYQQLAPKSYMKQTFTISLFHYIYIQTTNCLGFIPTNSY